MKHNVNDFYNFKNNREEDKKIERSIKDNHIDTQKYPKNSKLRYDLNTKKMGDVTKPELEEILKESLGNMIASLNKMVYAYRQGHTPFEARGFSEGIEILRKSSSLESGVTNIKDAIGRYEENANSKMEPTVVQDIINGLNDLLLHLSPDIIEESVNYSKITRKKSYHKLKTEMRKLIREFKNDNLNENVDYLNNFIHEILRENI